MTRLKGGEVVEIRTAVGTPDTWQAITCQVTEARLSYGASRSRGVLTQGEPGALEIAMYDPDRTLDPSNASGPFVNILKAGLWLRLSYDDGTRTILKQGYLDSLEYDLVERTGRIRANDWVAWASRYQFPNVTKHAYMGSWNNLGQINDGLIAAINLASGSPDKIPFRTDPAIPYVMAHPIDYPNAPTDPPGPIPTGPAFWDHLTSVGEAYLYMVWMSADLMVKAVDSTVPHGPRVEVGCPGLALMDFQSRVEGSNIVNALTVNYGGTDYYRHNAPSVFAWGEQRFNPSRPVPFNGRWDGNSYATAVINDRGQPSLEAVPLRIIPQTAAELRALLAITPMQQVHMTAADPALSVYGRAIGAEIGVTPEGWEALIVTYIKPGDVPLATLRDEVLEFQAEPAE